MKRYPSLELLDVDAGDQRQVANAIRDLQMLNRWFGGVDTMEELIRTALSRIPEHAVSLLEVASGVGYVPETIRRKLSGGHELQVTMLDRLRSHLNGSVRSVVGDALQLPFADNSFHLVSCNLFLHHLDPTGIQHFAREALRVCRTALLIHDLIRNPVHLALAYAAIPLYRSHITRNDAPASVRQAYTPDELRHILRDAGVTGIEISRHYLYRMGVIAWKPA